ncbi:MAG: hypothetical protein H6835_17885 [Planctomycetes bacterium]|nr:hypothetical protein [Planctomycetota bacterium]
MWRYLAICTLAAGVGLALAANQQVIQYRDGVPYDANAYAEMAFRFAFDLPIVGFGPYVYCVGLPYLVGTLFPHDLANVPHDSINGFLTLNLACAVVTVFVLGGLVRRFVASDVVLAIVLLAWVVHPQAPFRFVAFWPAHTDPPAVMCMAAMLLVLVRWPGHSWRRTAVLVALTIVGTLVREIVLLTAAAAAVDAWWAARRGGGWSGALMLQAILPTLVSLACIVGIHASVQEIGDYTLWNHAVEVLAFKASHPSLVPLALLMMHGPMIALLCVGRGTVVREWLREHPALLAYVAMVVGGSLIGGNHIDRFLFWTHPVVFPMLAVALVRCVGASPRWRVVLALVAMVVAQALAFRVFGQIPNSPEDVLAAPGQPAHWFLAPYGDGANFAQTTAAFMHEDSRLPLLMQHLGVFAVLAWLLWSTRTSPKADATRP